MLINCIFLQIKELLKCVIKIFNNKYAIQEYLNFLFLTTLQPNL